MRRPFSTRKKSSVSGWEAPHKLALRFHHHNVVAVKLGDGPRRPILRKLRQLYFEIHFTHSPNPFDFNSCARKRRGLPTRPLYTRSMRTAPCGGGLSDARLLFTDATHIMPVRSGGHASSAVQWHFETVNDRRSESQPDGRHCDALSRRGRAVINSS